MTTNNTAQSPKYLRVFLASPGDVAEERKLAQEVLDRLPDDPFFRDKITIRTIAWDKPGAGTPMLATLTPQEAIKHGLPEPSECDIVIVILWSRMGTPLPSDLTKPDGSPYRSGTEWEYYNALEAAKQRNKPKLVLYHRTEKVLLDQDDPQFDEKRKQWLLVQEFFAALRNPDGSIRDSCNDYATTRQFKEDLNTHLRALILKLVPPEQWGPTPVADSSRSPRPDLRAATTHYLSYLLDRHQYLNLKGMGLSERVPLQLPLLDLYISLQARLALPLGEKAWDRSNLRLAGRNLNAAEQEALTGPLSEPHLVLELLQQWDGLVVLGDPGAGKTTFLKYLVLQLAAGKGAAVGLGERLPLLAPLSGYANALEKGDIRLDDFIADYFHDIGSDLPLKALLTEALDRGAALVLLDGLDEVQDDRLRHLVVERVVDFFTLCRKTGNKFVITSRIIGYRAVRPVATGLAECTLVDFDEEEIKLFVERWTQALEKQAQGDTRLAQADAERERKELLEAVKRNAGVRQLAANPLLLTILALMKRQGVTLPERRVELYDQYVKTLLSTWNRARGLGRPPTKDLDPVQTIKILAPLALWMHETNPGVGLVKREAMRRELEALYASRGEANPEACTRQFLADAHDYAGLLLERGPGEYGFIHQTFEEYLAAVAIALQAQGQVDAIVRALAEHVGEPAWHETGLLTVGYLGLIQQLDTVAGSVVETLISQQPGPAGAAVVLAGEATINVGTVGIPSASRRCVTDALVKTTQQNNTVPTETRERAGRALATLGDSRHGVEVRIIKETGLPVPDIDWVKIPAGPFIMGSGEDDDQADKGEKPAHELTLPTFFISRYPITNAQYRPFVDAKGYEQRKWWTEAGWDWRQGAAANLSAIDKEALKKSLIKTLAWRPAEKRNRPFFLDNLKWNTPTGPVIGVSWYEALAYCRWLEARLRDANELPAEEGTLCLPSEAQWEKAARGPNGNRWPWGNDWREDCANTVEAKLEKISPVGIFPEGASPYPHGVQDMAGNVWEWTRSGWGRTKITYPDYDYDHYPSGGREALEALQSSDLIVVRGGVFGMSQKYARCAVRHGRHPSDFTSFGGFRVVWLLSKPVDA